MEHLDKGTNCSAEPQECEKLSVSRHTQRHDPGGHVLISKLSCSQACSRGWTPLRPLEVAARDDGAASHSTAKGFVPASASPPDKWTPSLVCDRYMAQISCDVIVRRAFGMPGLVVELMLGASRLKLFGATASAAEASCSSNLQLRAFKARCSSLHSGDLSDSA